MAGNILEHVALSRANNAATWFITPQSPEVFGPELAAMGPGIANVTAGANGITLMPLTLQGPFVINQFWWQNGTTVGGNSLMGIYNEAGSLLVSTALTANGASGTLQMADITDYTLFPGRYYIALGTDSGTHQYQRWTVTAPYADYLGVKTMVAGISGGALVSTVTFAVGSSNCLICGIMGGSVI